MGTRVRSLAFITALAILPGVAEAKRQRHSSAESSPVASDAPAPSAKGSWWDRVEKGESPTPRKAKVGESPYMKMKSGGNRPSHKTKTIVVSRGRHSDE